MIIEKHFTWPGGGQYYSLGVNVLGGIYVVIRCCGLLGLIIFQPLQHGYVRSKGV